MMPVLQVDRITKTFTESGRSDVTAVDHVSFQLMPGEILGLVGESGSGKSTIAKLITRLIDVTDGCIWIDGEDVTIQQQIIELLQELQKEKGLSYLFICHNLALVQEMCSRVLVMYKGKIIEEGTPDQIIQNPREDYTKLLVNSVF